MQALLQNLVKTKAEDSWLLAVLDGVIELVCTQLEICDVYCESETVVLPGKVE